MRNIQSKLIVISTLILILFKINPSYGQKILVLDVETKLPIPFSVLKCGNYHIEADLDGYLHVPIDIKCDTCEISFLGYNSLKFPFAKIKNTRKHFLQPISYEIAEMTIAGRRIDLINEISTLIKKQRQKEKHPIFVQSEMLFQTRIDSTLVENCSITSSDQFSKRNGLQQLLRHKVMYSFALSKPFFSIDLDLLVKDYCVNTPNKSQNHMLQMKKINQKELVLNLLENESIKGKMQEIRSVKYILKNGNHGIIKYSWPDLEIFEYTNTILGQNIENIYNINPINHVSVLSVSINKSYLKGNLHKVRFISIGKVITTNEDVSSVMKLNILPSDIITIFYPEKLNNNIQEDATLLFELSIKTGQISNALFDQKDLDTTLITVDNLEALSILDSLKYHKNSFKLWNRNINLDSTQYKFIPKKYDGFDKDISFSNPNFNSDIRWVFQKSKEEKFWKSIPSIWIAENAYFIKDHPTIAHFLANVIFGIFESKRRETLYLLNHNINSNEEENNRKIELGYQEANMLSKKFVKAFSNHNSNEIMKILNYLQELLDIKYLIPDPKSLYKFNSQKSEYSFADIHYILGNKEKAISEYYVLLDNPGIKKKQKMIIYHNLSVIWAELGNIKKSEEYKSMYKLEENQNSSIK